MIVEISKYVSYAWYNVITIKYVQYKYENKIEGQYLFKKFHKG